MYHLLTPNHGAYLSFISALHIHDVVSQIPQVITIASTAHSKEISTPVGTYQIHQISPDFFDGFDWNKTCDYLIATPEKALIDCLYLASRRGKQYAHFPELDFEKLVLKVAKRWAEKIKDEKIRKSVMVRLKNLK